MAERRDHGKGCESRGAMRDCRPGQSAAGGDALARIPGGTGFRADLGAGGGHVAVDLQPDADRRLAEPDPEPRRLSVTVRVKAYLHLRPETRRALPFLRLVQALRQPACQLQGGGPARRRSTEGGPVYAPARTAGASAGRISVKQEPRPGRLATSILPPWRVAICSTIDSPMPVPASPDASAPLVR